MCSAAYGNYNDLVRQASFIHGQVLAIWDFEYVSHSNYFLHPSSLDDAFSSLDSDGATPAQSESYYDQLVARRPSNVLALNHETEGN